MIVSLCIFAVELAIMLVCEVLLDVPDALEAWGDPLALALAVSPLLYFFLFRPMTGQIRERQFAEASLRDSEQRLRALFESAPDAILVVDREGRVLDANPQAASSLGYARDDLVTLSLADIEAEDPTTGLRQVWNHRDDGSLPPVEYVHRRKDGSTFPVEVRAQVLEWEKRSVLLALVRDVTERKRAEDALRYSEAKYASVVENSVAGIFIAREGRIAFANRRLGEMLGYSASALSERPLDRLVQPEDWVWLSEHWGSKATKASARGDLEARFVTQGGQTIWVLVSSAPIDYRGGFSILGHVLDISERKLAERALAQSQAELSHLSEQLIRAQEEERERLARELHDSVGQTLTAIQFVLEREIGEVRPDERRDSVRQLKSLLTTVRTGIDELHRISMGLHPSVLDDLGLLPTVSWFCREIGDAHEGVRIEWHLDVLEEDIPDRLKLVVFRILQEAVNNAVKHSGGEAVRVSIAKDGGGSLQLRVEDDGRGFDAVRPRLETGAKGGLGLGYMKERARQSRGTLRVVSSPTGTVVVANWPVAPAPTQGVTSPLSMA